MDTYTDILRRWPTAGALKAGLGRHGCEASAVLIRRWWNDEMLPSRAWAPLAALAKEEGHKDVTLARLASIGLVDRKTRVAHLQQRSGAAA